MTLAILAFAFAALGSKVLLGLAVVYIFIPDSRECSRCDGDTTPVEAPPGLRTIAAWARVQSRWCPRCGEHFLARVAQPPRLWVGPPAAGREASPVRRTQALERRPQ